MLNIEGDAPWLVTLQTGLADIGALIDQWIAPLELELEAVLQEFEAAFA